MKKIITIGITICQFIFLPAAAQEKNSVSIKKKQQYCSSEITMMNSSVETFALAGFAGDSIVVFPISTVNNHLQIRPDREKKLPAHSIKQVKIRVKKIKNSPEIFIDSTGLRKHTNTVNASDIQGTQAIDGVGNGLGFLAEALVDPIVFVPASIVLLPVIIPIAIFTAKEKTYHINGQAKRMERMERRLTRK